MYTDNIVKIIDYKLINEKIDDYIQEQAYRPFCACNVKMLDHYIQSRDTPDDFIKPGYILYTFLQEIICIIFSSTLDASKVW